jgi:histidinol-phosphate/aromatic aminotransferase/cobyric acid decarboxylase-like protein
LARHGGYWRFPELRDFCYLVNPYFPPAEMVQELARSFETLLREYPSSAEVQDELAAKMFGCDPASITVGNGAAELICELGEEIAGARVGVPVPTFDEYLKRFPHSEVVELNPTDHELRPDVDRLTAALDGLDVMVLVNPDNPSGQCLTTRDVLMLAEHAEEGGKRLVLDESFVDFAQREHCESLLDQHVLDRFPSLVVVKSISKSYGVPGARLGVLATADAGLLAGIRARRPVWNINSFGEYFLQIIGKYQDQYAMSCDEIRAERTRLIGHLDAVPGLKPLPSHANYVLCEVESGVTAATTAARLLRDHRILVKDASGKTGLAGREFLRIAIKSPEDNDVLAQALHDVVAL